MTIWVMVVALAVLCLGSSRAIAWIQFNDGQTHNIDYPINDDVWVDWESPGMETTLIWLEGASVSSYHLKMFEDSHINILGGSISSLLTYDNSYVGLSGRSITEYSIHSFQVNNNSQVNISGGSMRFFHIYNDSQINISGKYIDWSEGFIQQLYAHNNSYVNISGGYIDILDASDSSQLDISGESHYSRLSAKNNSYVNISGGLMDSWLYTRNSSQVDISGGSMEGELRAEDNAILTIHGSDFAVDGQVFGYSELTSILGGGYQDEPHRHLTGLLASGDLLDNYFRIGDDAKIALAPPPPTFTLTIDVDPNDVGIDTTTPSVGTHNYGGWVTISAERFVNCPDVYEFDHWGGDVTDPNSSSTTVNMNQDKSVTAVFVDDRQCGDECHPYPAGDINKNCIVDFTDFALFCQSWLECTKPECD